MCVGNPAQNLRMFEILSESSQTSAWEILRRIHESLKINQFRKFSECAWKILTDSIVIVGIVLISKSVVGGR